MIDNKEMLKDPDLMTKDQIEQLLPLLDPLIEWAKQVQEYALEQALKGEEYDGYKVVEGRTNRKFEDEDAAMDALKAAGYDEALLYERKLQSMSKLETLVGKRRFTQIVGDYIVKPTGKPVLVPETDPRPVYDRSSAADDFAD